MSHFTTRQLHADGHEKPYNAHVIPIVQNATFSFETPEDGAALFAKEKAGYIYTRLGNPTTEAVEAVVASLEDGTGALHYSSGMAAVFATVMTACKAGDHVIYGDTLYGPSITLMAQTIPKYGIESTPVDTADLESIAAAVKPNTKLIFFETPANPTLKVADIAGIVEIAKSNGVLTGLDNTFATPYFQRPLEHGVDIVVHSATKFLNGHGDVVGGFTVTADDGLYAGLRKWRTDTGSNAGPFDSWLILRGLRTLSLRMERHNENAMAVAKLLDEHPAVETVYYPGLKNFPGHDTARKQMSGYSSLLAFELSGGIEAGKRLLTNVKIATLAVSLGSVDTLIQHPASMTHAGMTPEERARAGITDGLVRLSVGIENIDDLLRDFERALG